MGDLDGWAAWTPKEVAERLANVAVPWYVAGGWAIDLFLGRQTRHHEDIEIGVPAHRFDEVARAFADCDLFVAGNGRVFPPPATTALLDEHHQTWVRDRHSHCWRLDILREPSDEGMWVARRDAQIKLPYSQLIRLDPTGIPYAAPEVVLLFKAKAACAKDEADLLAALPQLSAHRRRWLREALDTVHPGHVWTARLRA